MSQTAGLLQQLALTTAALASGGWVGRHWLQARGVDQAPLFCALLGFLLAAGAGLLAVAQLGAGLDSRAAGIWLAQATWLLGLPLIVAAGLVLARRRQWQRATWGRVVIGLCVSFELARRLSLSQPYAIGLGLVCATLLFCASLRRPFDAVSACALAAALLVLAAVPFPGNALGAWRPLLLALALPLLAFLLVAGRSPRPREALSAQ